MHQDKLSPAEYQRYDRQLALPEFTEVHQVRLRKARVLVAGAGGLGCAVLPYLAAAGVGHITIIDQDQVELSNLHRQILYTTADLGRQKAEAAREKLQALNPSLEIQAYADKITVLNADSFTAKCDLVVDGTDNFPARYALNDSCLRTQRPLVSAAVNGFSGTVSVFNFSYSDGTFSPDYRHLFPEEPQPGTVPSCDQGGVLGVLPGIIGTLQALEVIKLITGLGKPLIGRMLVYDSLTHNQEILAFAEERKDWFGEKGVHISTAKSREVRKWIKENTCTLVDVREPTEYGPEDPESVRIPISQIAVNKQRVLALGDSQPVVFFCASGIRSKKALRQIARFRDIANFYHLEGGLQNLW